MTQIPFVWRDLTVLEKKLKLTIGSATKTYNLETIQIYKPLISKDKKEYQVELKVKQYSRCLEIQPSS